MKLYLISNLVNGKVYVGQTKRTLTARLSCHLCADTYLSRALKKYGRSSFSIEQIASFPSQEELDNAERVWIIALNSTSKECGYNRMSGGATYSHHSEHTRKVISEKAKLRGARPFVQGVSNSPEAREKQRIAHLGVRFPEDRKRRQRERLADPEVRARMSEVAKRIYSDPKRKAIFVERMRNWRLRSK